MRKEVLSLTGMRFVAAAYVFVFHINIRWPISFGGGSTQIISQGAIGMSVFFVLSGFILAYQYHDRPSIEDYWLSRISRIYPIYLFSAVLTLPWIYGVSDASESMSIGGTTTLVLANLLGVQAWVPSYFTRWNDSGSWSISVEFFCYAVLPFVLPILTKARTFFLVASLAVIYAIMVLFGRMGSYIPNASFPFVYAFPLFRLPEFLIGAISFILLSRSGGLRWSGAIFSVAAVLFIVGLNHYWLQYVSANWFSVPCVAVAISCLYCGGGIYGSFLASRPMVWLGKISYCFYSFQFFILTVLVAKHNSIIEFAPVFGNNFVLGFFAFLLLVVMSAAGFYCIEEPCRKGIKKLYVRNRPCVGR